MNNTELFENYCPVALDFEFNNTSENRLNVICGALSIDGGKPLSFDLRPPSVEIKAFLELMGFIEKDKTDKKGRKYVIISHSVEAEAGALYSLGLDPRKYYFIDTMLEFKALTNANPKYTPLVTLTKDGWESGKSARVSSSLSSMVDFLLGIKIDTREKDEVRALIIAGDDDEIDRQMSRILEYCESDVVHLVPCLRVIDKEFKELGYNVCDQRHFKKMVLRGAFACVSGLITRRGYPVNVEAVEAFRDNIPAILSQLKTDINERLSPSLGFNLFHPETLKLESKKFREHLIKCIPSWPLTESGLAKIDEDTLTKFSHSRHSYLDTPVDQYLRYLRVESSVRGFKERRGKKSFFDTLGSDKRSRPYQNIFGSKTGRSQPSSTGFIFLKSAWMRGLVHPPPGRIIIGLDYVSQEFLIAAQASSDKKMVGSYSSGDPYLAFAKISGQAPETATRESHGEARALCKSSVLGIMFGMGAKSLAQKLSQDMGREVTVGEARRQINLFESSYSEKVSFDQKNKINYEVCKFLELPDGWPIFGGNKNSRSVVNFPIQGRGASIMRRAVLRADVLGLDIIFTLHDAIYIEANLKDLRRSVATLAWAMREAYRDIMHPGLNEGLRCDVRLDGKAWGDGLIDTDLKIDVGENYSVDLKTQKIYLDKRGEKEFHIFKKYLSKKSLCESSYD